MAGTSGSGGRNALSPAIHAIRGTFDASRHEGYDVLAPPPGTPEPPLPLEGLAADEWERMLGRLALTGAMSKVDDMAVYQHCKAFADVEALERQMDEDGEAIQRLEETAADEGWSRQERLALYLEIGKMRQRQSGYPNKIRQGRDSVRKWLLEFGLTPAARTRVKLPPKKPESKLDKFRKGA